MKTNQKIVKSMKNQSHLKNSFFSTDNENNIVNNNKNSSSQNNYTNNFNDNQNKTYFDIQKERKQNYLSIEDLKKMIFKQKKLNLTEQENSEILQASIHSSESNTNTSYDIASNYINIDNQTNNQLESLTNIHQKK